MASATNHVSIKRYHEQYADQTGYEYWFGEVVRKTGPTWLHALLQGLLVELLVKAGYAAGSELELRIDPDWEPRPDVVASLAIEEPNPTKPVDIVAEVLSPEDRMDDLFEKVRPVCSHRHSADFCLQSENSYSLGMEHHHEKSGARGRLNAQQWRSHRLSLPLE